VALSMDEQRILDEMERKLADDDPRLASRFASFGQPRMPDLFGSSRTRLIASLLAVALIAAVALVVYVLSPFGAIGRQPGQLRTNQPSMQTSAASGHAKT
jgi:Protein of unknown function (DUF3040)